MESRVETQTCAALRQEIERSLEEPRVRAGSRGARPRDLFGAYREPGDGTR